MALLNVITLWHMGHCIEGGHVGQGTGSLEASHFPHDCSQMMAVMQITKSTSGQFLHSLNLKACGPNIFPQLVPLTADICPFVARSQLES